MPDLDLDAIAAECRDSRCRACDGEGLLPDAEDDDYWGNECHVCEGRGRFNVGRWVPALIAESRRLRAERDRLRDDLTSIRDADPVDMALDPNWAARIATHALEGDQ